MSWQERIPGDRLGRLLRQGIAVAILVRLSVVSLDWVERTHPAWSDWSFPVIATVMPGVVLIWLFILQILWFGVLWLKHAVLSEPFPAITLNLLGLASRVSFWLRDSLKHLLIYAAAAIAADIPLAMALPFSRHSEPFRFLWPASLVCAGITWWLLDRGFARRSSPERVSS